MTGLPALLAVPYDYQGSGTIVFAERLQDAFARQGMASSLAVCGLIPHHVKHETRNFASEHDMLEWIERNIQAFGAILWLGVFQTPESRRRQISLSVEYRKVLQRKILILWERTGSVEVIPEDELFDILIQHGVDGIITLTKSQTLHLMSRGVPQSSIHQIGTGVDVWQEFTPVSNEQRRKLRTTLGWPIQSTIILSLSRFVTRKRTDFLIETWLTAEALRNDATLVLVGSAFGATDSIEDRLFELAQGQESIVIIRYRDGMNRSTFYRASDVFVTAGVLEGEPTAIVEAMACGLPVVASKIAGHTHLVRHGETGYLFQPNNAAELRTCLLSIRESTSKRFAMGQAARELVSQTRDIETIAAQYLVLLRD